MMIQTTKLLHREKMVFEDFGNLEREFRKLDEKVSDARSSQVS
jgi:hypothetical protein